MTITANELMYVVLTVVIPFLASVIFRYVKIRTDGTLYESAMDAIIDAVNAVQQTYVGSLKETGKFDADAQEEARKRAIDIAVKTMSEACVKYLNKICGSAEDFIRDKLESCVALNKRGGDRQ